MLEDLELEEKEYEEIHICSLSVSILLVLTSLYMAFSPSVRKLMQNGKYHAFN